MPVERYLCMFLAGVCVIVVEWCLYEHIHRVVNLSELRVCVGGSVPLYGRNVCMSTCAYSIVTSDPACLFIHVYLAAICKSFADILYPISDRIFYV